MTSSSWMKQHLMQEVYKWANILNLSYDRTFSSKKIFCWKHKTLLAGHSKHITHSSLSSLKEMTADWHKKWFGSDDKTLYFTHTGYYVMLQTKFLHGLLQTVVRESTYFLDTI